jgi:hypothetical protein
MQTQRCGSCGEVLDVSGQAPGTVLSCGRCRADMTVGKEDPFTPPAAPVRHATTGDTHAKELARRRLKAARRCATSMYVAFAAPVALLLSGFAPLVLGIVAIVMGFLGLAELRRVGTGGEEEIRAGGLVRAAARIAKGAPAKAWVGIGVGLAAVALGVVLTVTFLNAQRSREALYDSRAVAPGGAPVVRSQDRFAPGFAPAMDPRCSEAARPATPAAPRGITPCPHRGEVAEWPKAPAC